MKEHWEYRGAEVARGMHPDINGKRCYRFRHEHIGTVPTILMIPVDEYWGRT